MAINTNEMKKYYSFDLKDGYPYFTEKNLLLIDALIRYNSDYSVTSDKNHPEYKESYSYLLESKKADFFNFEEDVLEKVVKSIDKINSTHLTSEGNSVPKGEHDGITKTVNKIKEIGNLKGRMMDRDPKVVFEIASAVETKYNFSFASKFCAYVCELALDKKDGYCIYDNVVQAILPLYIYRYVGKETAKNYCKIVNETKPELRRIESKISELKSKDEKDGYKEYRDLIDAILKGIKEIDGIDITYSQFDHMLWYYFKGSKQRVQEALNSLVL